MITTDADPVDWLRTLPKGVLTSVEIGVDRLEDLYQLLLSPQQRP